MIAHQGECFGIQGQRPLASSFRPLQRIQFILCPAFGAEVMPQSESAAAMLAVHPDAGFEMYDVHPAVFEINIIDSQ